MPVTAPKEDTESDTFPSFFETCACFVLNQKSGGEGRKMSGIGSGMEDMIHAYMSIP